MDIEVKGTSNLIETDEELKLIEEFFKLKRHILSFFDKKTLIEVIKNIIKESKFKFINERAEKQVTIFRPTFQLKYESEDLEFFKSESVIKNYREDEIVFEAVYQFIIKEFSSFLISAIKKTPELQHYINNELTLFSEEIPKSFQNFLISSIFSVSLNINGKNIYIEYLL